MPTRWANGPRIANSSYYYFGSYQSNNRVFRKKPIDSEQLLRNPTVYSHESWLYTLDPDMGYSGVLPPSYGPRIPNMSNIPTAVKTNLLNRTLAKVLAKIKDEKWNLGTFLGELPETQKFFKGAIESIVNLYLAVKRGKINVRSLKRLARKGRNYLRRRGLLASIKDGAGYLSSKWLMWRYAVCPLVYDLDDMMKYLHRSTIRPLFSRVGSGGAEKYQAFERGNLATRTPSWLDSYSIQSRCVVYYRVNPYAQSFKQLGLINLPAVLWELTPLSFVVDMFLPVGDYIGHLDAMAGVTVLSAQYSLRIDSSCSRPALSFLGWYQDRSGKWASYTHTVGGTQSTGRYYSRSNASLAPTFSFSNSPGGKQLLDLVALSRQLLFSR